MKKIGLLILLFAMVGSGYYLYQKQISNAKANGVAYPNVVKESSSTPVVAAASQPTSLTTMLEAGINTQQGVIVSERINQEGIDKYRVLLNSQPLNINAVSEIELVKAFILGGDQVLLLSYNQGGNQCSRQYQFVRINAESYSVSKVFGSCLPISSIDESSDSLMLRMPQNNPYLGPDVLVDYRFKDGEVTLVNKPSNKAISDKYSALGAKKILEEAARDGCYVDGVLLDDNSCGGGRKYCVMFKSLKKKERSADYKTLAEFCSQP